MHLQTVSEATAVRKPRYGYDGAGPRLRQLRKAIYKALALPPGNAGTAIREGVYRLADLRFAAERARRDKSPGQIYMAELLVRRAAVELREIVDGRRTPSKAAQRESFAQSLARLR